MYIVIFFFKQKTAYEIYQCDWSSDVCSSDLKKKDVTRAIIIRQKKQMRRKDGSYISFDDNAVVLIEKRGKEMVPRGNRVFGPVPRELSELGWQSIISAAPEVV